MSKPAGAERRTSSPAKKPKTNSKAKLGRPSIVSKDEAKQRLLRTLQAHNGKVAGSVRGIARMIGGKKSTVQSAIVGLIGSGAVARVGSELMLVS